MTSRRAPAAQLYPLHSSISGQIAEVRHVCWHFHHFLEILFKTKKKKMIIFYREKEIRVVRELLSRGFH